VGEPLPGEHVECRRRLVPEFSQLARVWAQLRQPRRANALLVAEKLEQQFGPVLLHRIGHRSPGRPQTTQRGEFRGRPLLSDQIAAEHAAALLARISRERRIRLPSR
jgi:hypothetical protein